MGLFDFLFGSSEQPSCSNCLNCNARIKKLPSGKTIRVFTCPYTEEYDEFNFLDAVNPFDQSDYTEYSKQYLENIQPIYNTMQRKCIEQPGGTGALKNINGIPITTYAELTDYTMCRTNLKYCKAFKPCLEIDYSGSSLIIQNEMIKNTSLPEINYEDLSDEDKKRLDENY